MKTNTVKLLALVLCLTLLPFSAFAENGGDAATEYYSEDFSSITDTADLGCYGGAPDGPEEAYAKIYDGALWFGKDVTGKGASTLTLNFDSYLADVNNYKVSYDLTSAMATVGGTVNMVIGGRYFCIRSVGSGKCTVEWHDGSSWITTDKTEYDFSGKKNISIIVKDLNTVDLYIGGVLYRENMPIRDKTRYYTRLWFIFGNGTKGKIGIDNILVTSDLTVTPGQPDVPEDLPDNPVSADDVPPAGAPGVDKDNFDLYLAIGQSNMAGRAPIENRDRFFIPNAYLLNGNDEWERAQVQYIGGKWYGMNRYSTVRKENNTQGVNPALYFAKTLSETVCADGRKIGIIGNARGDTNIAQWQKGYSGTNDYDLYEEAVRRAKTAAESGNLKGIIWHQGCGDITTPVETYVQRFTQFVSDVRADLGNAKLPIFIGEIPDFADTAEKQTLRVNFNKNVIARLAKEVRYCYVISSEGGGHIGDYTHFDAATQRTLGIRYAESVTENIYNATGPTETTVSFDGVSGSAQIDLGGNTALTLTAEAQSGIECVEIYVNGALFTTLTDEPYTVDFSALAAGAYTVAAVAKANGGDEGRCEIELTVTATAQRVVFEDADFEQTIPDRYDSGLLAYSQRGYVKTDTVDAQHGSSLLVGIDKANEDFSLGSLPYINIPLGGLTGKFTVYADMYVSAKENSGDKKFTVYQSSGNEVILIQFKDVMSVLGDSADYDSGRWYAFRADIDLQSSTADVYCDGTLVSSKGISANLKNANYLRLYGPRLDTTPSYTAIDNIKAVVGEALPQIVSVNGEKPLKKGAAEFDFAFSDAIGSLNADDVSVKDESDRAYAVSAVNLSADKTRVTVTLGAALPSGRKFRLILGGNMRLASGTRTGVKMYAPFETESESVAISSVTADESSGKMKVSVTAVNGGGDTVTVVAAVTLWRGDVYLGMSAREIMIDASGSQTAEFEFDGADGAAVEAVLYTQLSLPIMLGNGVVKK